MKSAVAPVTEPDHRTPIGINIGVGAAMVVVAAVVAAAIPVTDADWRFGLVAAAVVGFAALTVDVRALAGIVALSWLLVNGFLIDRFGTLSWHGSPDLVRLMLLVLAGAVGLGAGEAVRGWWSR